MKEPQGPIHWAGDVHDLTRSPTHYIALSGGGFRATAHHMGALMAHLRHNLQHKIMAVCGVSGGAVAAAGLLLWWDKWQMGPMKAVDALRAFVQPLVDLMRANVRRPVLASALIPFGGRSTLERHLQKRFCGTVEGHDLKVLPPLFVFPSTDLSSGLPLYFTSLGFTMRPHRLWERHVGTRTKGPVATDVPLARAVAASAAFPPLVRPIRLTLEGEVAEEYLTARGVSTWMGPWDRLDRDTPTKPPFTLHVTDGGVADNLGLSFLIDLFTRGRPWSGSDTRLSLRQVFAYDAGRIGTYNPKRFVWRGRLASRALEISGSAKEGHLSSLASRIMEDVGGRFSLARALRGLGASLGVAPDVLTAALSVRTDLDRFTDTEIYVLAYIGYRLALLSLSEAGLIQGGAEGAAEEFREITAGLLDPKPEQDWARHLRASSTRFGPWRGMCRLWPWT